jgi:hypothetical protein
VFLCRPAVHVARSLGALDGFVETLVLEFLAANDIGAGRESERQVDLGPLRTDRAALAARLGEMFAAGAIEAGQLRRGSGDLRTQIAGIDTVLAEAAQTSPLAALAVAVDEDTTLDDHWATGLRRHPEQGDRRIGRRDGASRPAGSPALRPVPDRDPLALTL